ncbi:MAG: hypothetical protein QOG26_1781 [Solirubrobacterales bacterium]|jgi:hypothetical protein|nr:hypothetical protein [Solirubrobacterales bacterium]MDX6652857.1 hypothetical protein [Solirubrobacterales bacterium]
MSTIRARLTYANVVATIALFIALGGGAVAASTLGRDAVKSRNIAPNAVHGSDVKESSLGTVPDADALGGLPGFYFQLGVGYTDEASDIGVDLGSTVIGAYDFAGGQGTGSGSLDFSCDAANPVFTYHNASGAEADLWINGDKAAATDPHYLLLDGSSQALTLKNGGLDPGSSAELQIYPDDIIHASVSAAYDPLSQKCAYAISVTEQFESLTAHRKQRAQRLRLGSAPPKSARG